MVLQDLVIDSSGLGLWFFRTWSLVLQDLDIGYFIVFNNRCKIGF